MRRLGIMFAAFLLALILAPTSITPANAAEAAAAARSPSLAQTLIGSQMSLIDYRRHCRGYRCYYCKYRRCDYYGECRYWGCYWRGGGGYKRRHHRRRHYHGY